MAQTHFLLPLDKVSSKIKKELKNKGIGIPPSFVSQHCEMTARFMLLEQRPFYFFSRPEKGIECYRRVEMNAYLVSYKMYLNGKDEYFLAFGCSIDKVFEESYANRLPGTLNQTFWQRICTDYDLIYLQKAIRGRSEEELFYPLYDSDNKGCHAWIKDCVKEIAGGSMSEKALYSYIPEYAAIDVRVVHEDSNNYNSLNDLSNKFNEKFFAYKAADFESHWEDNADARLAFCLLKGNENMHNVSKHQIEKYGSHGFTNNRHEMEYVGQSGIVFLHTHHPFLEQDQVHAKTLQETLPTDLTNVQNIYELCAVLSMKKRIRQLRQRLEESPNVYVRTVLARLANMLNDRLTNVVDFNNEYQFIYEQMHVLRDYENLKQACSLLTDAYNLTLSLHISRAALLFTISAFCLAFLQILQNHVISNNENMNTIVRFVPFLSHSSFCPWHSAVCNCNDTSTSGDNTVIICTYVLATIVGLLLVSRYVLYPLIKDLHKRLHRDMEDNL